MKLEAYYFEDFYKDFEIKSQNTKRDWMDVNFNIGSTKHVSSFAPAYKCLPLKIGNELGWAVHCPIDFSCTWNGEIENAQGVSIKINDIYKSEIVSHFGNGILTFKIPYLFRTDKRYSLYVRGPTNYYKEYVQYLDAVVETDWMNYTFTYNVKIHKPNHEIFFKKGEPILSFIPIKLEEINNTNLVINDIKKNKKLYNSFKTYGNLREKIYSSIAKKNYEDELVGLDSKFIWMKDYYKGGGLRAENKEIGCPYLHFKKLSLKVSKDLSIFWVLKLKLISIKNNLELKLIKIKNLIIRAYFLYKL